MLTYNTQQSKLHLPEYGRTIQTMVDYCTTIADRDERNRCAAAIIDAMMKLIPSQQSTNEETIHKLWDHLALMSDYKLDVDYPCEITKKDQFAAKPERISYREENFRFRHYGRYIERLIATALTIEDTEARHDLELLIANQMKKIMTTISPDSAEDSRIFSDLAVLSKGEIRLHTENIRLNEYIPSVLPGKKKKK